MGAMLKTSAKIYSEPIMQSIFNMNQSKLRYGLCIVMALTMLAMWNLYHNDGTSIAEYYSSQQELERVHDAEALDYTDSILFGDPIHHVDENINFQASSDSSEGFKASERIRYFDRMVLGILTVFSFLMLIPQWHRMKGSFIVYGVIGVYLFFVAYCISLNGGQKFSELSPFAHATRWLGAIALSIWLWQRNRRTDGVEDGQDVSGLVIAVLILATASTFITHGIEALQLHPGFVDLILGSLKRFSLSISEAACYQILFVIGVMDIALGGFILFSRNTKLLVWVALWGAIAALSRTLAHGPEFWMESIIRTTQCYLPLTLAILFIQKEKMNPTTH